MFWPKVFLPIVLNKSLDYNLILSSCKLFYTPLLYFKTLALNSAHLQEKMPSSYVKNAYVVNEWVPQGPSSNHTNIGILSWCAISNVVKETHCLL